MQVGSIWGSALSRVWGAGVPVKTHAGHHLLTRAHLTLRTTGVHACTHINRYPRNTHTQQERQEKKELKQTYGVTLGSMGFSVRPIVIFLYSRF